MNTRTTLFLAVVLACLVAGYAFTRNLPKATESDDAPKPQPASAAAKDLIEKKLGDVVKVSLQLKGKDAWTFEKKAATEPSGNATWRMTAPMDTPVASWEIDKFGRELGRLSYEVSYAAGEPGAVTPEAAGLNPPEAIVSMTDDAGATASVEIGKPAGDNETYVRLAGGPRVCVGKANLRTLYKTKALEYRDQQLWNFAPENVTTVVIDDRTAPEAPVKYAFVKDAAKWTMTSPATAKATGKVDDMLRAIARLRVTKWHDDAKDKLAVYGLDPAGLTIRVTVEEKIPAKVEPPKEGEEPKPEAPPEIKTTVHTLHVSNQSPIGEDTSTYLRVGDESAVATILKSTTDKFKPVMNEWRDMKIASADLTAATRVELNVAGQKAAMALADGTWSFEGGGKAEGDAVTALLKSINDLKAAAFVEDKSADEATFGFSQPQAEIKLVLPGADGDQRVLIGNYTDERSKLMTYVRRGDNGPIAKVRTTEIEPLLRKPNAYADRTILSIPVETFTGIALQNSFTQGGEPLEFTKSEGGWQMTKPVTAAVRTDRIEKLVTMLANLRATSVTSDHGFWERAKIEPTATVTARQATDALAPDAPPVTHTLAFGAHEGKHFARLGNDGPIFEIAADMHKLLLDEYRTAEVLSFDDKKVTQFSIRKGETTHVFAKKDGKWTYAAEPDFALDPKKVDNLLLQLKDLKTERYVRSAAKDLGEFGLSASLHEVTVTLDDGGKKSLLVSQDGSDKENAKGKYACLGDSKDVFLLTDDTVKRFEVNLPDLEKK